MKVGFIINSLLTSKEKIDSRFFPFENEQIKFYYFLTEYAGHAIELSEKLKEDKFDWIVSVGGDGTLNEIVNGIMAKDDNAFDLPSLAMWPVGTGNDYSLSIKTTSDPEILIKTMLEKSVQMIDIGKISSEKEGSRYFINVADAGMGGEITREISTSGNRMGKWVYYKTILKSFFTFKRPTLKITTSDREITSKILTVVIGKGISFGGGYRVVYDAKLNDGTFFVAVIGDISIITYLLKIPKLMKGVKLDHPLVHYFHAERVVLENVSDIPCYLEMDGEPSFSCPATFTCLASRIKFLKLS